MAKHLDISDEQLDELRRTGSPIVVHLPDGAELVVQDAAAYRRMIELLDEIDLAESGRICAERWQAIETGADPGATPEVFFADLRRKLRRTG
ncbi:MAG: hypothetical protein IT431_02995 [Phycisphaerales bacterium]|nr:hypothetical protein [Phycisphaerales bacterium]